MKTALHNIGPRGRLHYDFLYCNQRAVINAMRLKGTLHDYLMGIDKDAKGEETLIPRLYPCICSFLVRLSMLQIQPVLLLKERIHGYQVSVYRLFGGKILSRLFEVNRRDKEFFKL